MLKSKIHGARIIDSNVNYEGSITIDLDLMEAADLIEYEEVLVWDITNGTRLATYVIPGERGSGRVAINGAAAHLVKKDDKVIVGSFASYDEAELADFAARKVFVDDDNKVKKIILAGTGEKDLPAADAGARAELC